MVQFFLGYFFGVLGCFQGGILLLMLFIVKLILRTILVLLLLLPLLLEDCGGRDTCDGGSQ